MDVEAAPPAGAAGASVTRSPRLVVGLLLGSALLVAAYASFMVPLLRGGLADAPMVTLRDSSALYGDFSALTGLGSWPEPLATGVHLFWFATIALGPLAGAVGLVVAGSVAVREATSGRQLRAAAASMALVGCAAMLVVALSPWGRTAEAWFFD